MAPPKGRGRTNNQPPPPQPSDYETDAPLQQIDIQPPPPRSNGELNLSVLRRHYPDIVSIFHIAQYAAVYIYSQDTEAWEKTGVEGTLFVCELTPSLVGAERFGAVILNRRGLDNFRIEIPTEEELDILDGYVVMQGDEGVYGLWIFSEQDTSTENNSVETAEKFRILARKTAESRLAKDVALRGGTGAIEQAEDSIPMGRQLSLRELFGQQRAQDAAWSVHDHHSIGMSSSFATTPDPPLGGNNVLAQLFMKAKQDYNGVG